MKSIVLVSSLLGLIAPAFGAPAVTTATCKANPTMVTKLKACASGASVCAPYITTVTKTATTTITLSQKTVTKTVSQTTSVWTESTTIWTTPWVTVSTTYTDTSYTTKASCPASLHQRSAAPTAAKPPCKIATDAAPSVISSACNCAFGTSTSTTKTTSVGVGGTTTETTTSTLYTTMPGTFTTTSSFTTTEASYTTTTACATPPSCYNFWMKTTESTNDRINDKYMRVDGYYAQGYGEASTGNGPWTASTFNIDYKGRLNCPSCNPSSSVAYIDDPPLATNEVKFIPWVEYYNSTLGKATLNCKVNPDGVMECSSLNNNVMYLNSWGGLMLSISIPPSDEDHPNYEVKIRQKCA